MHLVLWAGAGWSFLQLQHLGSSLQAVPMSMLFDYWSCAHQVHCHQCVVCCLCVLTGNADFASSKAAASHNPFAGSCCLHTCAGGLQMGCGWLLLCCLQNQHCL